ncbi:MAG: hypothetical protein MAG795_00252 [Candidatus Woesearchaeota archaeon]|nr:hypothetical protein [Candidatus Woesearchaeota archaeon]
MIIWGIIHIVLSLIAYIGYIFVTIKSFTKKNYLILSISNILYFIGFLSGMIWAKLEWGFYLNMDIKTILSIALFIPFFIENISKTKKNYWLLLGTLILVLNYILPLIIGTLHSH